LFSPFVNEKPGETLGVWSGGDGYVLVRREWQTVLRLDI
jgi:hypothetical protein